MIKKKKKQKSKKKFYKNILIFTYKDKFMYGKKETNKQKKIIIE